MIGGPKLLNKAHGSIFQIPGVCSEAQQAVGHTSLLVGLETILVDLAERHVQGNMTRDEWAINRKGARVCVADCGM